MSNSDISAVILAAGKGTRMKSSRAKVLHEVFFKPMLHHVLETVTATKIERTAVIIGHQRHQVEDSLNGYSFTPVVQEEQLGTGHAVLCAETACGGADQVMILCGDTPLIRPQTLRAMIDRHQEKNAALTLMTTLLENPFGYGRIISHDDGHILKIVEQKDADEAQRALREINAGLYLADADFLFNALRQVGTDNSQGEVYLTDIVSIAVKKGHKVEKFIHSPAIDVLGVNSKVELAQAHAELQLRRNRELMLSGVTMYLPETILVAPDVVIGQDTTIQAGVRISGQANIGAGSLLETGAILHNCRIGEQAVIGAHSVLRNCVIEDNAQVAPLSCRVD